jgi:hypothetical protein
MGGASTGRGQWREGCRGDTDVGGAPMSATRRLGRSRDVREAAVTAGGDVRGGGGYGGAAMSAGRRLRRGGDVGEVAMTAWRRLRRTRRL